jgi:hypothetical protein
MSEAIRQILLFFLGGCGDEGRKARHAAVFIPANASDVIYPFQMATEVTTG